MKYKVLTFIAQRLYVFCESVCCLNTKSFYDLLKKFQHF